MSTADDFMHARQPNEIRVELECGHTIRMRIRPLNPDGRYACTSGLGCGYRLQWRAWWSTRHPDSRYLNRKFDKET